jgi:hypothetical protein
VIKNWDCTTKPRQLDDVATSANNGYTRTETQQASNFMQRLHKALPNRQKPQRKLRKSGTTPGLQTTHRETPDSWKSKSTKALRRQDAYSANRTEMARCADTLASSHASGATTTTTFLFRTLSGFLARADLFRARFGCLYIMRNST